MKNIINEIKKIIIYRFNLDEDKAGENEIIEGIKRGVEFKGFNIWTLIFAIFIASIGLNINSTAVIIGAMLISPLMGPIMGIGLGAAILDLSLLKNAAKNLSFAIIIALVTSFVYFLLSPLNEANSELLARTNPTIWDILIALFGGLTGIIAGSRKNLSNAIPGVAIATALMPPLCTAGYGLSNGNFHFFFGAFYLFLINAFFICLSTYWIIKLLKFKIANNFAQSYSNKIKKIIYLSSIILILPSLYFGFVLVKQEIFSENINNYIKNEITSDSIIVVSKSIDQKNQTADLILFGENLDDNVISRIKRKKDSYDLSNSIVNITSTKSTNFTKQQDYSILIDEIFATNKINQKKKDSLINELNKERIKNEKLRINEKELLKEFSILFGKTKSFSINKTIVFDYNYQPKDTIALMYLTTLDKNKKLVVPKIEDWLKVRLNLKNVKVIIDNNEF
jgi:uncharacterized hydrophobic protein (TIGR00271 family)